MTEPHADRGPETSLWANHDWSLLWASRAVSGLGSRATDVAYPLLVLALTHSAVQAGAVMTVSELATLAGSLVGGVWVDRVNRRAVILSCEAVRCLTTCALGVLVLQGLASLAVILLAASITGLLAVPSALALSAASVRVIPPERMEESMRLQEARAAGTALAGPALAGVLFSVAAAFPFLADGVSYAATFVAGLRLRVSLALEKTGETQSSRAETATAGVRWLASHPTVAATAASLAFFTFVSSGCQVLVIILARRGGTSSAEVGAALAIAAAGGAAGVLVLRRAVASLGRLRTVLLALWLTPLAVAALAITSGWLGLGLFYAIVVALEPAVSVVVFTKLTLATPDALRGRVSSLLHLITSLLAVLAPLTAGALIDACGTTAPVLLAIPGLASALLLTATPALRGFVAQEPSPGHVSQAVSEDAGGG